MEIGRIGNLDRNHLSSKSVKPASIPKLRKKQKQRQGSQIVPDSFEVQSKNFDEPSVYLCPSSCIEVLIKNVVEKNNQNVCSKEEVHLFRKFESPQLQYLRTKFCPFISCPWCMKFYRSSREPRFYEEETVCSECIGAMCDYVPTYEAIFHPLNHSYIVAVRRFVRTLDLCHSKTPNYNQLEGALSNQYTCQEPTREVAIGMLQRMANSILAKNHQQTRKHNSALNICSAFSAITAVENCKQNILKAVTSTEISKSRLEMLNCFQEFQFVLNNPKETLSNNKKTFFDLFSPLTCEFQTLEYSKQILDRIRGFCLDLIVFVDVKGKRLYSRLWADGNSLFLTAFTPILPSITSIGLSTFTSFDFKSLEWISQVYFEIPTNLDSENSIKARRFHISVGDLDMGLKAAFLFLGNNLACFLGAEVEVTQEKIVFDYYMQDGRPGIENLLYPSKENLSNPTIKGLKGMVVSESSGDVNKLTIFKYDCPAESTFVIVGFLHKMYLGPLLKVSLGRHKITACGIGKDL